MNRVIRYGPTVADRVGVIGVTDGAEETVGGRVLVGVGSSLVGDAAGEALVGFGVSDGAMGV